jgi:hypothetical protein
MTNALAKTTVFKSLSSVSTLITWSAKPAMGPIFPRECKANTFSNPPFPARLPNHSQFLGKHHKINHKHPKILC